MLTVRKDSGGNSIICTHVYPQYEPRDCGFVWCTEERYGISQRDSGMFGNSRLVKVAHFPNRHAVFRTQGIHLRDGSGRFALTGSVEDKMQKPYGGLVRICGRGDAATRAVGDKGTPSFVDFEQSTLEKCEDIPSTSPQSCLCRSSPITHTAALFVAACHRARRAVITFIRPARHSAAIRNRASVARRTR
jgi:hypothetical protein